MNECDAFKDHRRAICRGERPDLTLSEMNEYRALWGFSPLAAIPANAPSPPANVPPILIRGWNFASAMARWTLAGMPRRTQAEIDERLAICQACPLLIGDHCSKCGCACVEQNRLVNKLALATEKCPEGKWK